MGRSLTLLVAVALLLSCCAAGVAADIFVATNGNDTTGNGSISSPYATLTKATSVAAAGDTIQVRAGSYVQHLYWDVGGDGAAGPRHAAPSPCRSRSTSAPQKKPWQRPMTARVRRRSPSR